jgi:hypothetical protein
VLITEDLLQFADQLREGLGHIMSAGGMLSAQIIGGLPLPDHVVRVGVVGSRVVVVHSALHHQVPEADAPGKPAQVADLDVVLSEELEQLAALGVRDGEDLLAGDLGVVGAVGHGPRVVVAVEFAVHLDMLYDINKIISRASVTIDG